MSDPDGQLPEPQPGDPAGPAPADHEPGYWERLAMQQQQPGWGQAPPYDGYPPQGYGQAPPYGAYPPGYGYGYAPAPPVHPMATTSLVLGCIALVGGFICAVSFLLGPVAIVLGAVAMRATVREPQTWGGRGLAIAGLVTGIVSTVVAVLMIAFFAVFVGSVMYGPY